VLRHRSSRRSAAVLFLTAATCLIVAVPVAPAAAAPGVRIPVIAPGSAYRQKNLISDTPGMGLVQQPLLVNPWGIAKDAAGPLLVANDGTSTTTFYSGDVGGSPFIPKSRLIVPGGLPTGTVANTTASDFVVDQGSASGRARYIFASITGNISGWNPNVPAAGSTSAVIEASQPGHVYTGLALANNGSANLLYAADFANRAIDGYDADFTAVSPGAFGDPTIPAGYAPYNIQAISGSLYVAYALVGPDGRPVDGVGNGYVRRFNTSGVRDLTFGINNGALNAPWGMVIAPASFGIFGGALLVGNAGEGNPSIHAYNPTTGAFLGTLQDESGNGIVIEDLHALTFGNGGQGGSTNTLYFTAGLGQEEHGILGSVVPTTASAVSLVEFSTDEYAIGEGSKSIQITVTRSGDASGSASVRYATWDESQPGHASQKSDYELNIGVVRFAAGQTSKTFTIFVVEDRFDEGAGEIIDLSLHDPVGTGLGSPNAAEVSITDNDSTAPTTNPIDSTSFFIRQHYLDFFGREPDAAGLRKYSDMITACGTSASCIRNRRAQVSSQILLSTETVDSLGLALRTSRLLFGGYPLYGEAMLLAQARRVDGASSMTSILISDPRYAARYPTMTNRQYVLALAANSGYAFTTATKNAWVAGLDDGRLTRATVLLQMARHTGYMALVRSRSIVYTAFWAYDRRDPDQVTFNERLNQLNAGGGNPLSSGMVGAFITGSEYRQRFGPS
jgi:uncharacterized protein (TIGR03118 family)